jgi:hypothetical protein
MITSPPIDPETLKRAANPPPNKQIQTTKPAPDDSE